MGSTPTLDLEAGINPGPRLISLDFYLYDMYKAYMKKKVVIKKVPPKAYLLAIRVFDEQFKDYKHEVFSFRSNKQRESMIRVCEQNNIEWATSESDGEL